MNEDDPDMEALMLTDDPDFERIMECVFGLQPHECRAYLALIDAPGSTAEELAETLDRDRSTVHRTLSRLVERELVERDRRLIEGGGTVYQYFARSLEETQERMHASVDEWASFVHEAIDGFGRR